MSQALRDLPDPTEPAPVLPAANADDLLAKMADEAIDKLLAEADRGPPVTPLKITPPPSAAASEADENAVDTSAAEAALADLLNSVSMPAAPKPAPAKPAEPPPAEDLVARESAGQPADVAAASPSTIADIDSDDVSLAGTFESPPAEAIAAANAQAEVAHANADAEASHAAHAAVAAHAAPADDVKSLLAEEMPGRPSPLLWPLWLLNLPFAWIGGRARQALGLIGIVTLVPAVCAIVYVLYMKKH